MPPSKKRTAGKNLPEEQPRKNNPAGRSRVDAAGTKDNVNDKQEANLEELEFEDPFGDEYEEEDLEGDEGVDATHEGPQEVTDANMKMNPLVSDAASRASEGAAASNIPKQVWRPGLEGGDAVGEELDYDPSAYVMYHSMRTEWPCLSFDILKDTLGDNRQRFPLTMFMVTGSQADRPEKNKITLLKISDLHKTHVSADSDSDADDDDEGLDEDPTIEHINIAHQGGVNRIRSMPQHPGFVATMADTKSVHVFDLSTQLNSMMTNTGPRITANATATGKSAGPCFSYRGHQDEGFAVDWSPAVPGRLMTGDCAGVMRLWHPNTNAGSWKVDDKAFKGHTASVEDIQWSPNEGTVLSSASADRTVRIWDIRDNSKAQISFDAHSEDVNVISWNRSVGYLLASGSDDGSFKVWDLRQIRNGSTPLAHFTFHHAPITSIQWAPHDESMLCTASADNQVTIWDLSVEADDDAVKATSNSNSASNSNTAAEAFPPQLLFIHQGQNNVKEVHFHPQLPGVVTTTAEDSFNIFKPAITVSS